MFIDFQVSCNRGFIPLDLIQLLRGCYSSWQYSARMLQNYMEQLVPVYKNLPQDSNTQKPVAANFEEKSDFPHCLGAKRKACYPGKSGSRRSI